MPDADELIESKHYFFDTPQKTEGFFLKGLQLVRLGNERPAGAYFQPPIGTYRHAGL